MILAVSCKHFIYTASTRLSMLFDGNKTGVSFAFAETNNAPDKDTILMFLLEILTQEEKDSVWQAIATIVIRKESYGKENNTLRCHLVTINLSIELMLSFHLFLRPFPSFYVLLRLFIWFLYVSLPLRMVEIYSRNIPS